MSRVVRLQTGSTETAEKVYLIDSSSGGGGGGDDVWRTSVETRLSTLHNDLSAIRATIDTKADAIKQKQDSQFIWLLGVYGAGFITILGVVAYGFKWIGS